MKRKPVFWCAIHEGAYKLRRGGGGKNPYLYVDKLGLLRLSDCDKVEVCPMCEGQEVPPSPDQPYMVRWGTV